MRKLATLLALAALAIPAAAQEATPEVVGPVELPLQIDYVSPVPGLLPEGVVWDEIGGTFLIGSLAVGSIHAVADDGTVTERFTDENLQSTIGLHIADGKLYAANSSSEVMANPEATGLASLAVFDLETGEMVSFTDLTGLSGGDGAHFANDVTVDADGNAYVTDSFQPVIYKVTPEGEGSVLVTSDLLAAQGFGLNGIDYHADGYLLAAVTGSASIVKIPLDDPEALTVVELSEPVGIDGMSIGDNGVLYAVARTGEEQIQEIIAIVSEDDWATAEVAARTPTSSFGTTLTLRHPEGYDQPAVYYTNTYFGETERTDYQISLAPLMVALPAEE